MTGAGAGDFFVATAGFVGEVTFAAGAAGLPGMVIFAGEGLDFAGLASTFAAGALAMRAGAALVGLLGFVGFAGVLETRGVFFIGNSSTHRDERCRVGTV